MNIIDWIFENMKDCIPPVCISNRHNACVTGGEASIDSMRGFIGFVRISFAGCPVKNIILELPSDMQFKVKGEPTNAVDFFKVAEVLSKEEYKEILEKFNSDGRQHC